MRSPFKIAPWSPCPSLYFDIAGRVDVGRQRFARKSQLREIYLGFMAIQFAHASSAWGRRVRIQTAASASRAHDALSPAIYLGVVRRNQDRRFYHVSRKLAPRSWLRRQVLRARCRRFYWHRALKLTIALSRSINHDRNATA